MISGTNFTLYSYNYYSYNNYYELEFITQKYLVKTRDAKIP